MLKSIARWFAWRRHEHEAVEAAIAHLARTTGEQTHRGMCKVVADAPERSVVRLCYGMTRPPRRAWFAVSRTEEPAIRELTWEEAQALGEKPWW